MLIILLLLFVFYVLALLAVAMFVLGTGAVVGGVVGAVVGATRGQHRASAGERRLSAYHGATAGGCLASHYLAAWVIARLVGPEAAEDAVRYMAPVGEKEETVARAMRHVIPTLPIAA